MNNKPQRPNVHVRVWVKVSTQNELSTSLTCINLEEAFHHTQNLLCKIVQGQDAISKQKQCSAEKTTSALSKRAITHAWLLKPMDYQII